MSTQQKLTILLNELGLDDHMKKTLIELIFTLANTPLDEDKTQTSQKKTEESEAHNKIAGGALKYRILRVMNEFSAQYTKHVDESELDSKLDKIMVDALTFALEQAQYQAGNYMPFTAKQIDHICYQIGEWYVGLKPLLEGGHNLGHQKERLKTMICGD